MIMHHMALCQETRETLVHSTTDYQGRIQDLWKGGGAAATASAAGAKVFGGSRLKTLFGISKGGGAPPESASDYYTWSGADPGGGGGGWLGGSKIGLTNRPKTTVPPLPVCPPPRLPLLDPPVMVGLI